MKVASVCSKLHALVLCCLCLVITAGAQTYTPVGVTGLNIDAIAEAAPSSITTTTQALDLSNHVMYSATFATAVGLPGGILNSGTLVSGTRTYQLYPFNGNNCLYIASGATQVLTLATPASYNDISLLSFATEGSSTLNITLGFTDGTTLSCPSINMYDWFFGVAPVYSGFGRCIRTGSAPYNAVGQANGAPTDPSFFPIDIPLSCAYKIKLLKTISVTQAAGNYAYVMAVSGVPYSLTLAPSSVNETCNGGTNGSAVTGATGTNAPYTYSWSPSGGTGANASGLSAGVYTCTLHDTSGCPTIQTYTITQPAAITSPTSQTNLVCNGTCNGSATVTPAGGTGAFTWSWTPSGGTASTASNLCAGTYTCTVKDANGCTVVKTFTITQPAVLSSTVTQSNILCNGAGTGTASVTPGGGSPAYTYSWSPSGGTGATASSLTAGTYTCVIKDANGCSISKVFLITQPTALTVTTTETNVSCNGGMNGSGTVSPVGGTGAYTYSWTPAGGAGATASALGAGSYTCTVTDANGCTVKGTANILQPSAMTSVTSQTNPKCNGACTGSGTVTPSGGTGTYTYSWTPSGGTTSTAGNLCAGNYTCSVTDANGCSLTKPFSITQPAALTTTYTQVNELCNGANTAWASVSPSGGSLAYTFSWTPSGGTGATASALVSGAYTCTITDANGCSISKPFTITQPAALTVTGSGTNVTCNGGQNGVANASPAGGSGAYTYSWTPSGGTGASASALGIGAYTCTVTDVYGCSNTTTVTITQPTALNLSTAVTPASCGASNGTATVTATGGTGAYTYSWNPGGAVNSTATGLSAGTYTVTVHDANSCVQTTTSIISNTGGSAASITSTNVSCNGGSNGSATCTATGGTPTYTYSWSPSGGTGAVATGLTAGSYTVFVTDANGCAATAVTAITQPAVLVGAISSTVDVFCHGTSTGSATATASGGTGALSYSWTPTGGQTATASGLSAGLYTLTVTDANGCRQTVSDSIRQPAALTQATAGISATCFGSCNGQLICIPAGGVSPYSYSWSTGCTGPSCNNICSGSYSVTVTDAHGCTVAGTASVSAPAAISPVMTALTAHCNHSDGMDSVSVSGGTPGYTYSWTPGGGSSASCHQIGPGTYTVTITDAKGCVKTDTVSVPNQSGVSATVSLTANATCFGSSTGSATAAGSGGVVPYIYSWSPAGGNASTATALPAGTYTCQVTDASGCGAQANVSITQPTAVTVQAMPAQTLCMGSCVPLTANGSGGTPVYTYSWSLNGNAVTSPACPASTSTYTVVCSDQNGCLSASSTVNLALNPPLDVVAGGAASLCPGASASLTAVGTGGNAQYRYSWTPSAGLSSDTSSHPTATPTVTTTYTVIVTDNCGTPSDSATVTVTLYPAPVSHLIATDTAGCAPFSVSFTETAAPACASASWTFGDGGTASGCSGVTHVYGQPGTYSVGVHMTDIHGCNGAFAKPNFITIWPAPEAAFSASPQPTTVIDPDIHFMDLSTGASSWNWNFGDFVTPSSSLQNPHCVYPDTGCFTVSLIVTNAFGCKDTATHPVCILPDFTFFAPNAFTPNGDQLNETWQPKGTGIDPKGYEMEMFNRWGNRIWETHTWGQGWDGRANNGSAIAQTDVYVWKCTLTDFQGRKHAFSGICSLIK